MCNAYENKKINIHNKMRKSQTTQKKINTGYGRHCTKEWQIANKHERMLTVTSRQENAVRYHFAHIKFAETERKRSIGYMWK